MTSPDVSVRNFIVFSASVLGWIVVLSLTLKFGFDAEMSGGWLIVGAMLSGMVVGAILMVKEIQDAFLDPEPHACSKVVRLKKSKILPTAGPSTTGRRRAKVDLRRTSLGLNPQHSIANRRRRPRLLSPRRGPTLEERVRYWLITSNMGGMLRR